MKLPSTAWSTSTTTGHWLIEQSKDYFNHYYGPGYPPDSLIKVWLAHGSPKDCAKLIQEWLDMGITTPVLRFTAQDQPEQVKRFVDEVLPLFG